MKLPAGAEVGKKMYLGSSKPPFSNLVILDCSNCRIHEGDEKVHDNHNIDDLVGTPEEHPEVSWWTLSS